MNYYRITAYHPDEDISVILDSNGRFDALWEFSTFLVDKGFKITTISRDDGFDPGNILKASASNKIIIRAATQGRVLPDFLPSSNGQRGIKINDLYYVLK